MILLVIFGVLFLVWLTSLMSKPKNFPPGPPRLPFIGSLPFMRGSGEQPSLLHGLEENVKEFGPVFGFYFGQTPAVVIADFEMLREAFKTEQLAGRPSIEPNHEMRDGTNKLISFDEVTGINVTKVRHRMHLRTHTVTKSWSFLIKIHWD